MLPSPDLHPSWHDDHIDDKAVAGEGEQGDDAVEDGEQHDDGHGHLKEQFVVMDHRWQRRFAGHESISGWTEI